MDFRESILYQRARNVMLCHCHMTHDVTDLVIVTHMAALHSLISLRILYVWKCQQFDWKFPLKYDLLIWMSKPIARFVTKTRANSLAFLITTAWYHECSRLGEDAAGWVKCSRCPEKLWMNSYVPLLTEFRAAWWECSWAQHFAFSTRADKRPFFNFKPTKDITYNWNWWVEWPMTECSPLELFQTFTAD